jgi:hypothetical protein
MVSRSEEWLRAYELKGYHPKTIQQIAGAEDGALEEDLHYAIMEECERKQWIYLHGSMAHRSRRTVGEPDFTILADGGRVFFIECKRKSGKRSTEQLGLAMWSEKLGHTIHLVKNIEQFRIIAGLAPVPSQGTESTPTPAPS